MITTILRTAEVRDLNAAARWTADCLHIPEDKVSHVVAVAYVCQHFEQGDYSGWDGFVEMRAADQRIIDQYNKRKANKR